MNETQEKLATGIGTKEIETLKPAKVKIENISFTSVKFGTKTNEKVVFTVKHPDRDENINISTAKILKKDKVKTTGIWYTIDDDGKIQKGSTLAMVLSFVGVQNLSQMKNKELDTIQDDDGYLCLKCY